MTKKALFFWTLALVFLYISPVYSKYQQSPLSGQGTPQPETTDIYVSAYLNRLLNVDPRQFQFTVSVVVGLSWVDYSAAENIRQDTLLVANGTKSCNNPCTFNRLTGSGKTVGRCCDTIYLPTFAFVNDVEFPTYYSPYINQIYTGPNGQVIWLASIQGTFFQAMASKYPFESNILNIAMEFLEPGNGSSNSVTIRSGSAGPITFLSNSLGDDSPFFNVDKFHIGTARGYPLQARLSSFTTQHSNVNDPSPLGPKNGTLLWLYDESSEQYVLISLHVTRFVVWTLFQGVLPVVLVGLLAFTIFLYAPSDSALKDRISALVMLFLSLSAIQFVIINIMPPSSYLVPMQQLSLMTYILYAVLVLETIAVCYIAQYKSKVEEKAQFKQAREDLNAGIKELRESKSFHDEAADMADDMLHLDVNSSANTTTDEHVKASTEEEQGSGGNKRNALMKSTIQCTFHMMSKDTIYGCAVACRIDFWCFVSILFLYCLGVILIFVLGSGEANASDSANNELVIDSLTHM